MTLGLDKLVSLPKDLVPKLKAYGIMDAEQLIGLCFNEDSKKGVKQILCISDDKLETLIDEIEKLIPYRVEQLKKKVMKFPSGGAKDPNERNT